MSVVELDWNVGESGSQVLRIALCLSVLYKIPVKINNIRAGCPCPGLTTQHLQWVQLLKSMCNAEVDGDHIDSTSLQFKPNQFNEDKLEFLVDNRECYFHLFIS